jgi:UDP-N-acetylglucosamine 2-epimerase (non-hydrolysing)
MVKPLIFCIVGTRPEAVKMAPVVRELRRFDSVETRLISTGQHKEILLQALATFGLTPDIDLAIMSHGQTLAGVTSKALEGIDRLIDEQKPGMVIGQGDTTTAFVAALAAFYRRVPFAHVEAGLRTESIDDPFPEEFNRRAAGLIASLHFPPTDWAQDNLLNEGKDPSTVVVTGNTGIDAVLAAAETGEQVWYPEHEGRIVLLTTHRRENWGEPQTRIAKAARELVDRFPDVRLVVAMHPNPQVRETLKAALDGHDRIDLIDPPEYERFVKLMQRSALILSDSGGVQEEAPAFGIPVLVLRGTTERPEGVHAGTAKLVGTEYEAILNEASALLGDESVYNSMAQAVSPYGDGRAAARVRYHVMKKLGLDTPQENPWNP